MAAPSNAPSQEFVDEANESNRGKDRKNGRETLGKLADLLDRQGIPIEEIGRVRRMNAWQSFHKSQVPCPECGGDKTGCYNCVKGKITVAEHVDLVGLSLTPKWADGPAWPVVQPAPAVKIQVAKARRAPLSRPSGWERAFIFPDIQYGYRQLRDRDGALYLDPFHNEQAIQVALSICEALQPEKIIFLGDCLDFPAQSKYVQEPSFALTTQDALNAFHTLLATVRQLCQSSEIVVIEGNHDMRLAKSIMVNAAASFGIQRANLPREWPVLTVPFLCRFDELDIQYVGAYPAGEVWINDNLVCIHGMKIGNASKSAASRVVEDERVSNIFGHVHSIEMRYKTRRVKDGQRHSFAASPGCLCRTDGAVPSVKGGIDPWGRPVTSSENWQNGVAVVEYEPGDGRFNYEQIAIFDGAAVYRGELYEAA